MSSSRAALTLAPIPRPSDLASARQPLVRTEEHATIAPGHPRVETQPLDLADFPVPKVRERVTFVSMRVPNSLLDQVEAVCKERAIDRTALILHFVRQGLRTHVTQP